MAAEAIRYGFRWGRAIVVAVLLYDGQTAAAAVPPKVVEGYTIERAVGEEVVRFPMFACFDDAGRLFVTESSGLDLYAEISALTRKCRISVLEDKDGDGIFETARVWADGLVMPMGAAWRDGKLYVPDGKDLIALEDADGDGKAEKRTVILSGFGHSDNGGLHGITFGPDGLMYMTCGQPDGYRIRTAEGKWIESKSGSLLRCRTDGSGVECLARGFENLVEVVFLPGGDILGTVNWYQRPEGGIRDALVHLVNGGLYPYVPDVGTPQLVSGPVLPAVTKFPAVALSGLAVDETPTSKAAGSVVVYSAQHNTRNVGRHEIARAGATFASVDSDFVTSDDPDFHPSDVLQDADGSLIVVDTGSWYIHHCPTGQIRNSPATGGVYRVRRRGATPADDPRGLKINWATEAPEKLASLLADSRPVVRDRAQRELTSRGEAAVPALAAVASGPDVAAACRALWALSAIAGEPAAAAVRRALGEADADVVTTAARALGVRRDRAAAGALQTLAASATAAPQARRAAAESLAYCGDSTSLPAVWAALGSQSPPDRFLEHSLIFAAHHLADAASLADPLKSPHPRVQAAAMLLLDQPPRPASALSADDAFDRLAADDEYLRQVALQRVERHPEWAGRAVKAIREVGPSGLTAEREARLLRLMLAFEGNADVQAMVAKQLGDGALPAARRVRLVEALAQSRLPETPAAIADALGALMDGGDPSIASAAVKTASVSRPKRLEARLAAIAADARRPAAQRLDALRAVLPHRPRLDDDVFQFLFARLSRDASPLDRLTAASLIGQAQLNEAQAAAMLGQVGGDAIVSPAVVLGALGNVPGRSFDNALIAYLNDSIARGWEPTDEQLSPVLAKIGDAPGVESLRATARDIANRRRAKLAEFEPLLAGGDPARGRAVFFANKVACSTCHRIGSEGGRIGPDLTKVGAVRAGRDILESVVLPSSTIAQGFDHYVVQTKRGEVFAGVVPHPAADVLEIRDAGGNVVRVHKGEVARLKRQPISLMPDGLAAALTRDEFRDLLAFLQGLR